MEYSGSFSSRNFWFAVYGDIKLKYENDVAYIDMDYKGFFRNGEHFTFSVTEENPTATIKESQKLEFSFDGKLSEDNVKLTGKYKS